MSLSNQTIAVIGAGNIGRALVGGLLAGNCLDPSQIRATRRNHYALEDLKRVLPGVTVGCDNRAAVDGATIVVLAVKPSNWLNVVKEIRDHVGPEVLIVSVLAGLTTAQIGHAFSPNQPIIRTMPNTPMVVDCGATAISAGNTASDDHMAVVQEMFEAVGNVERVPEYLMDAVTGLSGSGPAYVYMLIEALTDAGVKQGLPRSIAFRLRNKRFLEQPDSPSKPTSTLPSCVTKSLHWRHCHSRNCRIGKTWPAYDVHPCRCNGNTTLQRTQPDQ